MKWIKTRNLFLEREEAKIKDVILPRQAKAVRNTWGESFLELEEIEPTDNIKQGKWKLSDEDKIEAFGVFFSANLKNVYKFFNELPDKFNEVLQKSIDLELLKSNPNWVKIITDLNIKKPSINQISILTDPIFRKISVSETKADEVIVRDDSGKPVMGEDGRPTKRRREEGEVIFSNNLTNINGFIGDYNRCFTEHTVDASGFTQGDIQQVVNASKEDFGGNRYGVEVDLYARDLFLSIKHNPKDILNISISRFYSSCQHLYSGGYRKQLLANVFDPNSIPAFLVFDTPIYDSGNDLISDQLPLCRMMIRNIETFDGGTGEEKQSKVFFDRGYPDRMEEFIGKMIEKYSDNKESADKGSIRKYLFTPDVPEDINSDISDPYMDRLNLERGTYIGINVDKLYLSKSYDWSKVRISPKAKLKEIVIETTSIPKNFFDIPLMPDWVKIKFIKIKDFAPFGNIKTNSYAFDKCNFDNTIIAQLKTINPDLKKLQLVACEITNLDLSILESIDELQLLYTLDADELITALEGLSVKKLVLSGDLMSNVENKKYIGVLKGKGIKVEIVGPII